MTRKLFLLSLLVILLTACGGGSDADGGGDDAAVASGDAVAGETLYVQSCSACHGTDAKGLPNLGKDLTTSDFVHDSTEQELLAFVKEGRPSDHPDNTTGVDMPPKGGNPALSDAQILDIIAYLWTLDE